MNFLAKNLNYLARREGLNQTSLGQAVGMTQPSISRLMGGNNRKTFADPGVLGVKKLAGFFGVSLDDLLGRDLELYGPSPLSQSATLDEDILSSALVSVKDALKSWADFDLDQLHLLAPVIVYSYELRMAQPRDMSRDAYRLYDESVKQRLQGELNEIRRGNGSAAETGSGSNGKAAKKGKKAASARK